MSRLNDACRHQGLIDVSKYPDDVEVPSFAGEAVCAKCGAQGRHIDVRPNWKEQPDLPIGSTTTWQQMGAVARKYPAASINSATCQWDKGLPSRAAGRNAMKIDGRCHCGYVSFEAEADPETTTICNCTDCQTMSGAPFRAVIITQPGTFVLLSGKPTEYRKTADSGTIRPQGFCPRCGTALYSTADTGEPKAYAVRVGALRQRNELVPRRQGFFRSQQAWVNDIASIPKFDGMPPR